MRSLQPKLMALSFVLGLSGCLPEVKPSNPYDPALPLEQQQKASLTGVVRKESAEQAALLGAVVTLTGSYAVAHSPQETGADGAFVFAELVPGTYTLEVTHAAHLRQVREVMLGPGEARELVVTLDPAGALAGAEAGHLHGTVLQSGELHLASDEQDHTGILVEVLSAGARALTGRQGDFDLYLSPGTYELTLSAADHHAATIASVIVEAGVTTELPGSPVVLDANPGRVLGVVTLEAAEVDLSGTTVTLLGGESISTAIDGSFIASDVAPGSYTLQASREGYVTQSLLGVLVAGGRDATLPTITMPLARGTILGSATASGADTSFGITVSLTGTSHTAVTNEDGDYQITGVPVGTYEVRAERAGHLAASTASVTVSHGQETTAPALVLLPDPGRLLGVVLQEGRETVSGVSLSLTPGAYTGQAAADGTFVLEGVLAGVYTLTVTASDFTTYTAPVLINAGADTELSTIVLTVPRGSVAGLVSVEGGDPEKLAEVRVRLSASGYAGSAFVDELGNYSFANVPVGTYTVSAEHAEFSRASATEVEVAANLETTVATLALYKITGDFEINGGDYYTNAADLVVSLTLSSTTAVEMRISESPDFDGGVEPWVVYDSNPQYTLSSGDGAKVVYVQYRDGDAVESAIYSSSIVLDTTPPELSEVLIDGGAAYATPSLAGVVTLTLLASDATSGVASMQISNDQVFDESFVAFETTRSHTLASPTEDGPKQVYARFRDHAGNTTAEPLAAGDTIELDTTPPELLGFTIDCGGVSDADYCNSPLVTITVTPSDPEPTTVMALSSTGAFAGATFLPFAATSSFMLLPGDGVKTVYLMLKDAAGNDTGGTNNDTVILDTEPPTLALGLSGVGAGGAASESLIHSSTVTVTPLAGDNATSLANLRVQVSRYANFTSDGTTPLLEGSWWALDAAELMSVELLNPGVSGQKRIFARVRDLAGNLTATDASIELDVDPPAIATPSIVGAVADAAYTGGIVGDAAVVLSVPYAGASSFVVTGGVVGAPLACAASPTLDLTLTFDAGAKAITVAAFDAAGNASLPNEVSITALYDPEAPVAGTLAIEGLDAGGLGATTITRSELVMLTLAGESDGAQGSGITEMMISEDAGFAGAVWQLYTTSLQWLLSSGDGEKTVRVMLRDVAGNVSEAFTDSIELDTTAPSDPEISIASGAAYTNEATPMIAFAVSGGAASYSLNGGPFVACVESCAAMSLVLPTPLAFTSNGDNAVRVKFRDAAGNTSSVVQDEIFFDDVTPAATTFASVTPLSSGAYLDINVAQDPAPGSGIDYYLVRYWRVGDSAAPSEVPFAESQGLLPGLMAFNTYCFGVRPVDKAGNLAATWSNDCDNPNTPDEQNVGTLIGLRTNVVSGQVAAFGDRLLSSRGLVLAPRMIGSQSLRLTSCDVRVGRCEDEGLVTTDLDLGALCGATGSADVAVIEERGRPLMFAACATGGDEYRLLSLRASNNPNEVFDLGSYSVASTLLSAGGTPELGKSLAAAANGALSAVAYFSRASVVPPRVRVHLCRASEACEDPQQFDMLDLALSEDFTPSGGAYLSMDAGETHLFITYPLRELSGRAGFAVLGCDFRAHACTQASDWTITRLVRGDPDMAEAVSASILEVGGEVYLYGLLGYTSGAGTSGPHVWRCTAGSHCDTPVEWGEPLVLATESFGAVYARPRDVAFYPRAAFVFGNEYLYASAIDYMTGKVRFARCKPAYGCGNIGDWVPIDVLETATINGQPELAVAHGNPLIFIGRDETHAYLMSPRTMAPLQRALVPDFERGGVLASMTPSTAESCDGRRVVYNLTGFTESFTSSVTSMEPAEDVISLTSDGAADVFGAPLAFSGYDVSVDKPRFHARGGELVNFEVSGGNSVKFLHHARAGDCHLVGYTSGDTVVLRACAHGDCAGTSSVRELMLGVGADNVTDMRFVAAGGQAYVYASYGDGASGGIKVSRAVLDGACGLGAFAAAAEVYTPTAEKPAHLGVVSDGVRIYLAHEVSVASAVADIALRVCVLGADNCHETAGYALVGPFGEGNYLGGDLAVVGGSHLYWIMQLGVAGSFVRRCELASGCDAAGEWSPLYTLSTGARTAISGALAFQDGRILWTHAGEMWWCEFTGASACADARSWTRATFSAELLSYMRADAAVFGSFGGDLLYLGMARGGYWLGRCKHRCAHADNWQGGFVARGGQFGAPLFQAVAMESYGAVGSFTDGVLAVVHPYLVAGDDPDRPKRARFVSDAFFDVEIP